MPRRKREDEDRTTPETKATETTTEDTTEDTPAEAPKGNQSAMAGREAGDEDRRTEDRPDEAG